MEGGALTDAAFRARLDPLFSDGRPSSVAVAVSGGPDSLALVHLARAWARHKGVTLTALTVDHGLRTDSAQEARRVAAWMAEADIPHEILTWTGEKPESGIQAAARAARYRLMTRWCVDQGVADLLLAHHRDDQAETLVLRLARGSGVDGLAAMRPVRTLDGVRLLRPLLDVPKAALTGFLAARGLGWVEDPSNRNADFDRVKVRAMMPALADLGLDAATLGATAARMARTRDYLDGRTDALLRQSACPDPLGFFVVDRPALAEAHPEIGLRALSRLLACIGGRVYPPRLESLERLWDAVTGETPLDRTLAGCRVKSRKDGLWLCREAAACAGAVAEVDGKAFWDNRFRVSDLPSGAVVGAMDADAWRGAAALWPDAVKAVKKAHPAMLRHGLPGVFRDGALAALPFVADAANGVSFCFDPVTPLFQGVNST